MAQDNEKIYLFFNGVKYGPCTRDAVRGMALPDGAMIKEGDGAWTWPQNIPWLDQSSISDISDDVVTDEVFQDDDKEEKEACFVVCPHCWTKFNLEKVNYISSHPNLIGDPKLGEEAQKRFLPTRFDAKGYAIDEMGLVCQKMACPNCHLEIPESCTQLPTKTFSIVGAPSSGKSYYLTSMIWNIRKLLSRQFDYSMVDTDENFNGVLNNYEQILFLNSGKQNCVFLPKTELQGSNYSNQVLINGMTVDFPLPFIFTLSPTQANMFASENDMWNIILYDNAGEHFEPGRDQVNNQATQHLVQAESIVFLYDLLKDSRMKRFCDQSDPQLHLQDSSKNQLVLLNEMINRIRKYMGLGIKDKCSKPLIVTVPKYDAWRNNFVFDLNDVEYIHYSESEMRSYLDVGRVVCVSHALREFLFELSPDIVTACENFFDTVYYLPVSALGHIPSFENGMIGIKPDDISPVWIEVPMLMQFWLAGLISGCNTLSKAGEEIANYKFVNNSLIYTLPGERERKVVPLTYCGYTVYSRTLQKFIKLPAAQDSRQSESATPRTSSASDDDFWSE